MNMQSSEIAKILSLQSKVFSELWADRARAAAEVP